MSNQSNRHATYLFWGDVLAFVLGLIAALWIRGLHFPEWRLLQLHIIPFGIIFCVWLIVYYIAELYEPRTFVFETRLGSRIINAQVINSGLAIVIFYFVPYFLVTPKTVLFIDLVITLVLIFVWRLFYFRHISRRERERAYIVGEGTVVDELRRVLTSNAHYGLEVADKLDDRVSVVVLDLSDPKVLEKSAELYPLLFTRVRFLDLQSVYEEIFGRVPLELLSDKWFLQNISLQPKPFYTLFKRAMDLVIALPLALVSLVAYPFVWIAIKLDDGGPLFIMQERVGTNNQIVRAYKFRSMQRNELDLQKGNNRITRVGKFLRNSRLDEFVQLWAVVRGDLSLIGPRPELPSGVKLYEREIPYYNVRHIIKPGISGWAQMYQENHPHHTVAVEETREKLSYDLYYIKNRSLWLDLKIALKTIKTLLSRVGA